MAGDQKPRDSSRAARRRRRYREIARVLWEERLLDAVRDIGLDEHLPPNFRGPGPASTTANDLPGPVRIRRALERLGPVYVKVGQMLATRADVVPPALLKELIDLQDDVQPVPWPEMKSCIEAELNAPVAELFQSIEEVSMAAASIGQVYRATLPDGSRLALKVRRPGITEMIDLDLEILNDLARKAADRLDWAREMQIVEFIADFSAVIRTEIDYLNEAEWLRRFGDAFADDDTIVFPGVHKEITTSAILAMDLLEGVPGTRLAKQSSSEGVDRVRLVDSGIGAYFRMIFELGFYHADPHAGNLFALPGGKLGFVDLGRAATVSARTSETVFDMLLAVFDGDSAGVTEAVLSMTGTPSQIDLAAFELDINALLRQFLRQQENGDGLNELMQGMLRLMRDHRLRIPAELGLLLTTLGVLDGVAHQIDPGFRMMEAAKPFAHKYVPERFGPEHAWRSFTRASRAHGRLAEQFPVEAARALRRVGEGEFKIAIRASEYKDVVDRLTSVVYLLAYAVMVSALIIGFAFLAGRQGLSIPELAVYRAVLFLAVASAIGLLVTVIRNERRKRRADKRTQR